MKPTFKNPHIIEDDPNRPGHQIINHKKSEEYRRFHALGRPDVIYAIKENMYYKDANCTKKFTDEEIQEIGLPIPIEIETKRRKMIDVTIATKGLEEVDMKAIYELTSPKFIESPDRIKKQLIVESPEDKIVRRLNRQAFKR